MGQGDVFRRFFIAALFGCAVAVLLGTGASAQNFRAFEDFGWGYGIDLSVPTIADLDGDGRFDLLVGAADGSVMHFEEQPTGGFGRISRHCLELTGEAEMAPVFTDLDGDGLLDLLVGINGGTIQHYEQEAAGSESFDLVSRTLGDIDIGACSRPFVIDLDGNGRLDILIGTSDRRMVRYEQSAPHALEFVEHRDLVIPGVTESYTHAALADFNADGRPEMIVATWRGNVQLFTQHETVVDSFLLLDDEWCDITNAKRGAPCIMDIDGDGLLDLLMGCYDGPIVRYEQPSAGAIDGWQEVSANILNTWDFGTTTTGHVVDLDGDGRLDILRTQVSEQSRDTLQPILHFRQKAHGDLRLETVGVLEGVKAKRFDMLTTTDFDNDGRLDLIMARADERVEYYRQSAGNPAAFELVTDTFLPDLTGSWTSLVPVFVDLDANGKLDLLLAFSDNYINRYEQQQAGSAVFELKKARFMTGMDFYPAPAFADLDGNGRLDMLVGTFKGTLMHYEQDVADPLVFNRISLQFQEVKVGKKPVPQFVDVNADGRLDIVLPDGEGGMSVYLDMGPNAVSPHTRAASDFRLLDVSPNPAATEVTVRFACDNPVSYAIRIHDALGREVRRVTESRPVMPGIHSKRLDLSGLPAGMYHVLLETAAGRSTLPLLLVR